MRLVPALAVTALLLAACSGGGSTASKQPDTSLTPSINGVQVYRGLSHAHLTKKADYPHHYDQSPPVGGPHAPVWLRCDVYAQPVPEVFAVHSIEHGGIWISYRPDLPKTSVDTLALLQKTNVEYVLVAPYPGLSAPIVVTTWGLQLRLDSVDDPRLREFLQTYAGGGQGGEPGTPCRTNGLTPAQAATFLTQLP
ncbi:MAG: DUF3105 domain-containing protein [Mycobacteriales bacterium]